MCPSYANDQNIGEITEETTCMVHLYANVSPMPDILLATGFYMRQSDWLVVSTSTLDDVIQCLYVCLNCNNLINATCVMCWLTSRPCFM